MMLSIASLLYFSTSVPTSPINWATGRSADALIKDLPVALNVETTGFPSLFAISAPRSISRFSGSTEDRSISVSPYCHSVPPPDSQRLVADRFSCVPVMPSARFSAATFSSSSSSAFRMRPIFTRFMKPNAIAVPVSPLAALETPLACRSTSAPLPRTAFATASAISTVPFTAFSGEYSAPRETRLPATLVNGAAMSPAPKE